MPCSAYQRILILKECCLGDVLMATPVLRAVRKACPESAIDFGVGAFARSAVEGNPFATSVLEYPRIWNPRNRWPLRRRLAYVRELRQRRYDLILALEMGSRLSAICRMIGAPVRIGFNWRGEGLFYTHRIQRRPNDGYAVDLYRQVLDAAGIPFDGYEMDFFPSREAREEADRLLPETVRRPLILMAPGGGENPGTVMPIKRWHAAAYTRLADLLVERTGATIGFIGAASDAGQVNAVRAGMHGESLSFAGACGLDTTGVLLSQAELFIGNDSGPMHLAIACRTPTVGVFGPTAPSMYLPPLEWVAGVSAGIACSPCHQTLRVQGWDCTNKHRLECMDRLDPSRVFEVCANLLERYPRRQSI